MSATVQISDLLSQRYRLKLAVEDTIANAGQSQTAPAAANSTQAPKPAVTEQASGPAAPKQSTESISSSTANNAGITASDRTVQKSNETESQQLIAQGTQTDKRTVQTQSTTTQNEPESSSPLFNLIGKLQNEINSEQLAAIFPSDGNFQVALQSVEFDNFNNRYNQKQLTSTVYGHWQQSYRSNLSEIASNRALYTSYQQKYIDHLHDLNYYASYVNYPHYILGTSSFIFQSPRYIVKGQDAGLYDSLTGVVDFIDKRYPNNTVNSLLSQVYNATEYTKRQLVHALAVWSSYDPKVSDNITTIKNIAYQLEKIKTALTYFVAHNTSSQIYDPYDTEQNLDDTRIYIPDRFVLLNDKSIAQQLQQLWPQIVVINNDQRIPNYVKRALQDNYNLTNNVFRLFTDEKYQYWQFVSELPYFFKKAACIDFLPAAQEIIKQGKDIKPAPNIAKAFRDISSAIEAKDSRYEQLFVKYALNYYMAHQLKRFQQYIGRQLQSP